MNKILPIILVVVLSGCAVATKSISPDYYMIVNHHPPLNKITTSSIGDTLVDHSYRYVGEGVSIKNDIVLDLALSANIRYFSGNYFLSSTHESYKCYGPILGVLTDIFGIKTKWKTVQFCVINKKEGLMIYGVGKNRVEGKFKVQDLQSPLKDKNFKQQFIYNGKVDNAIKFIYREFSGNVARSSFQQDIQYDLNESDIIGFKELKLKVIKATNQNITYKVLNNFSLKNNE